MIVAPGSTSVSVDVFFADDAGAAVTGQLATNFPACKWSGGSNTADTTITLSDLAAITTAHPNDNTAGGIKEREGGWYRLDLPNDMFTSAGRKTLTFAETTNKRIIAPTLDVQYVQGDVRQLAGVTQSLTDLKDFADAGYDPDTNKVQGVVLVDTLTTYTGDTPQTGDSYAIVNSGTHGNAAIKGYVDDIGAAGAGLSAIPWNAAWDAEVQSEVDDAIVARNLHRLVATTGTVSNPSGGTATVFNTSLLDVNNTWNDQLLVITSGALAGQAKPILSYDQTNGQITLEEGFTDAPSDGVSFIILAMHVHAVSQIQSGLSTLTAAGVRTAIGLATANLDTQLAAIVADTNELQTDWTNGGRLDLLVDAILDDTGTAGVVVAAASKTGYELTSAERDAVADAHIARNIAGGSSTGRTVGQAYAALRNKVAFDVPSAGSFTVFGTDDTTSLWTGTYTATVGANPVTILDPG